MTTLKTHYNNLFQKSLQAIQATNFQVDNYLKNRQTDHRFGLTLLLRPSEMVKNNIQKFLSHLKTIEPDQYYYPNEDLHVTVLSIISCRAGFQLEQVQLEDYFKLIAQSLVNIPQFNLHFKGLTMSPSSVMITGFYETTALNDLRDNLRKHFKAADIEQSIDSRYRLFTAHSTVVRFQKEVQQKQAFIDLIQQYRDCDFGKMEVGEVEFVFNDWYQQRDLVQVLKKYKVVGCR